MKWKAMVAQLANRINHPHVIDLYMRKAFEAGKRYRDAHPAWRKCEDEMPEEDGWYLVVVDGEVCTSYYCAASEWSKFAKGCVSHWLPLPKFNPKADKV